VIASSVQAVSKFSFAFSSSSVVGLKIIFPSSKRASLHQETGHSKGVQAIKSQRLAQTIHQNHKSFFEFEDKTVQMI
jgi:hypothetical protein